MQIAPVPSAPVAPQPRPELLLRAASDTVALIDPAAPNPTLLRGAIDDVNEAIGLLQPRLADSNWITRGQAESSIGYARKAIMQLEVSDLSRARLSLYLAEDSLWNLPPRD